MEKDFERFIQTTTFTVTNGKDGVDGSDGEDGTDGENGKDGISITEVDINENGELVISFSEGNPVNLGKVVGADGVNGQDGTDGISIEGATVDENGKNDYAFMGWCTEENCSDEPFTQFTIEKIGDITFYAKFIAGTIENVFYIEENGGYSIRSYYGSETQIVVPDFYADKPVLSICGDRNYSSNSYDPVFPNRSARR